MYEQQTSAAVSAVNTLAQTAEDQSAKDTLAITAYKSQITSLQSQLGKRVYDDLAYGPWWANFNAQVGGSGKGKISQDKNVFTLIPDAIAGVDNYFDCYFTKEVPPIASDTKFQLTNSWMLKTSGDVAACRCLEEEVRHVLPSGLQFLMALQANFASNQLRIFDPVKKWFATGVPMPKFTPGNWYNFVLDAHHDGTNTFFDVITINGVVHDLTAIPPCVSLASTWREELKIALQLDGKNLPYDAHYKDTKLIIG